MKIFKWVLSLDGWRVRIEREWQYKRRTFIGPPEPFGSMIVRTFRAHPFILEEALGNNALLDQLKRRGKA